MTGLEGAEGRTARELVPDLEEWWFETYGRVALTGEAVHFENHSEAMGRWFEVRASRIGGQESRRVALVFDDTTERKRAAEERDRLLAREWVAVAEEAERERISRELHDRVAHSMGVAHQSLELHDVLAGEDAERAEAKLDLAREMIKASLESTRNLSAELRRLDAEDGLEAELRHLLDVSVPPGIRADIHVEGDEAGVPGHVRGQLFLMLREAVRNAVSHSGCGSLSVGLDIAPERVVGSVEDDGQGFDDDAGNGGVGLRSMRERAALLDGDLKLDCEPGRGTRVELSVPLTGGR
jgi:signal transduction histidine kinase